MPSCGAEYTWLWSIGMISAACPNRNFPLFALRNWSLVFVFIFQRRKWLDDALSEMTISPVEEMQKNLKMIRDTLDQVNESALPPSEEACSTLQSALENIVEHVCSIDCANGTLSYSVRTKDGVFGNPQRQTLILNINSVKDRQEH